MEEEIKQLKVDVEVRVSKDRKEVEFDICSAFLFTLWKAHPDLDVSCFGEEAIEAVKKYAAKAATSQIAVPEPEPFQVVVDLSAEDVADPSPQDAAAPTWNPLGL